MDNKKNGIPKLRFPGFTGAWEQRKLGEVVERRIEKRRQSERYPRLAFASGQGVIPLSERKTNNREQLTKDEFTKKYLVTELDDIVYNPANVKYGAIDRNKYGRGLISPIYVTFTTGEVPGFIERIVKSHDFKQKALRFEEGTVTKRQSVNPEDLVTINILVASQKKEQKKISLFFDNIDTLIALHQRKLEHLQEQKKGLLQKMFPKNGEVVPEVRFPGFTDAWEQRKLGDIAVIFDGTHQTPKYTDSGIKFVSVENIATLETEKYISQKAYENEYSNKQAEKGDILMTRIGNIGTAKIIEKDEPLAYYVTLALLKPQNIDSNFLVWGISSPEVQRNIWKLTLHIAFPKKINLGEINQVTINIPSSSEQKKIGEFFQQLDSLIALHQRKLEHLELMKKGLLQQMFV